MNAEARRVLVLGILACLLGGYAYVTTPKQKTIGAEAMNKTERAILDFEPERVTKIDLVYEGQHLICERTSEGWQQPTNESPLRQDAVEDFLANLKKLVNLGEVEYEQTPLTEYGLQPPMARIVLQVEGVGERTLTIGKHNPVQTSLYAQVNESPQVVLVGAVVLWDMRKLLTAAASMG
jgi:uncharacterized protein DUF4340